MWAEVEDNNEKLQRYREKRWPALEFMRLPGLVVRACWEDLYESAEAAVQDNLLFAWADVKRWDIVDKQKALARGKELKDAIKEKVDKWADEHRMAEKKKKEKAEKLTVARVHQIRAGFKELKEEVDTLGREIKEMADESLADKDENFSNRCKEEVRKMLEEMKLHAAGQ